MISLSKTFYQILRKAAAVIAIFSLGIIGILSFSQVAFAAQEGQAKEALTCPAGSLRAGQALNDYSELAECNIPVERSNDTLMQTITTIINVVVGIVGLVAVIVIVVAGIFFVTSQGDAAKVTKAKNAVLYGVIGLIISLLAFAIVNFVLAAVFPTKTTTGSSAAQAAIATR